VGLAVGVGVGQDNDTFCLMRVLFKPYWVGVCFVRFTVSRQGVLGGAGSRKRVSGAVCTSMGLYVASIKSMLRIPCWYAMLRRAV